MQTERHAPQLPIPKQDDDLERMNAEADMLVAKLTADEESHREDMSMGSLNHQPLAAGAQDKWFYRDPQGEVQGPFLANEMAEWCRAGYFTSGLLVRRTCDERYATLGDLISLCGRVPFIPGTQIPQLKVTEQPVIPMTNPVPTGLPTSALPKPGIEDPLLMYQHLRLLQSQQLLLRQMKSSAFTKLSQSEHFATLSPVEQNQLIMQCVMQDPELRELSMNQAPYVNTMAPPASNPVMQLFNQMQQGKTNENHHPPSHPTVPVHSGPGVDSIQQFIQKIGNNQNLPGPPHMNPPAQPDDNPIKSLLRQLQVNANGHPGHHLAPSDSIWPQPPPQTAPQFNAQNWLAQVGPVPPMPPGQMPNALWDLHSKEMKTEQQILEEQKLKLQDDRKKEDLRRQVEDDNKRKMEAEARALEAAAVAAAKLKEAEKKRKEEEKRKLEEEVRKKEEKKRKEEERKEAERKEEERKREEKRKLDEQTNRRKQEEEKKRREEAKRLEEKMKKEEDKRRKLEEEQQQIRRLDEERLKREEDLRKKIEVDEQARRAEQRHRDAEALKKLQERSKAPWAHAQQVSPVASHASLAEIQRLQREKRAEEMRVQQQVQQLAQQQAVEAAKEAAVVDSSKRLQFKWAEKAAPSSKLVKSLAQIQLEEQERVAKVKQQEKERQEKVNQKEAAVVMQNAGIWGTAAQSLNWTQSSNSSLEGKAGKNWPASGFWEEPVVKPTVKPQTAVKPVVKSASAPQVQNNKVVKGKVKKEEEVVKKGFDNNTAKTDDFQQWCYRTLCGLQPSVDIPTFIGFLKDIESAYEVKEYVRMYLGDSKQTTEFTKQFLEKRSKLRSAQRPRAEADDLCKPAPAVNPNAPMEFQEVKVS